VTVPASTGWLARHELALNWRDFVHMMTAGRAQRRYVVYAIVALAILLLHPIAWLVLAPSIGDVSDHLGRMTMVTGTIALAFSLMGSQAMESVTRVFYSRSDLDLILSSPISTKRVFAVRIGAVVFSTSLLTTMLVAPAINVLALLETWRWLLAYPFAMALGTIATIFALCLTLALFRLIGARRTRLAAQIVAALISAFFIIGIQIAAIASIGTISRFSFLKSETVRAFAPGGESLFWLPARAAMGELPFLAGFLAIALLAYLGAVFMFSGSMAEKVTAAAGVSETRTTSKGTGKFRRHRSVASALRHKEWVLLARDHWLISQTLMQVLYLAPPAFLLWRSFGGSSAVPTVVLPVLVMAAGQLAGGLAWLAISGEDAPQLVATAPVRRGAVIRAKAEAVLGIIAALFAPILAVLFLFDPVLAGITAVTVALACLSAIAIQLWFRTQARRSNFRRRQTASRVATIAEAFSSISWAGSAALWANGTKLALIFAGFSLIVLLAAWAMSPWRDTEY
jgi:ABC-2 type transport system permease protein